MESKQKEKRPEKDRGGEGTSDSRDLRLDDLEDEIIDLVDVAEEGTPAVDAAASASDDGARGDDLELDDLELEQQASRTTEELPPGTSEQEMQEADEALGEAEEEFRSLLRDETDEPEGDIDDLTEGVEETTEESAASEMAELFPAEDMEGSKPLDDGPTVEEGKAGSLKDETSSSDEEFFEGLFDDLEIDEEGAKEVSDVPEEAPMKEEPAGDLLADLRLESEIKTEAELPGPPGAVEELPEDLFADLGTSEGTSPAPPPTAAGIAFPVSGDSAEELMALVRDQVEAVVTRLVEKRLPVIAERIIMEEIRKIKAAME